jgi:hypothetical protein
MTTKNKTTSYPKDKIKILLLENVSDAAELEEMRDAGYATIKKLSGAISEKILPMNETRRCAYFLAFALRRRSLRKVLY